jgi:hypothetical protein
MENVRDWYLEFKFFTNQLLIKVAGVKEIERYISTLLSLPL